MQRTALCLVAVLVVLSGCSGVLGGESDATPTAESTATPTPTEPTGQPASTFAIASVSPDGATFVEGDEITFKAIVRNTGNVAGRQTVELRCDGAVVASKNVTLDAGANTTLTLHTLETDNTDIGSHEYTVATANETVTVAVEVEKNRTFASFRQDVTLRTLGAQEYRVYSNEYLTVGYEPDKSGENLERYLREDMLPVPEATALKMASHPDPPAKVGLTLINEDNRILWGANLTLSVAKQYANGSMTPAEFRQHLIDRGTTNNYKRAFLTASDRTRKAYARELAHRLVNSNHSDNITVTEFGLYNETVDIPNTRDDVPANTSIYIEVQTPREDEQREYRNFSTTIHGIPLYETIYKWGNLSGSFKHGGTPKSVQIRFIDQNGTRFMTHDVRTDPAYLAVKPDNDVTPTDVVLKVLVDHTELYNGGAE